MIVLPPSVAQDAVWQNIVKQMNDELKCQREVINGLHWEVGNAHERIGALHSRLGDSLAAKLHLIKRTV